MLFTFSKPNDSLYQNINNQNPLMKLA